MESKTHFPCGTEKKQPVKLSENIVHYRACAHEGCQNRLKAFERMALDIRKAQESNRRGGSNR